MFKDYGAKDATDLAGLVASGEVDADALLDTALAAMERLNPKLNAVVLVQEEAARAAIRRGLPEGPFRGVPFLLKDLGCEAMDFPSHNGSRLFANTRYALDSAIWDRIRATGVVAFARTTAPEGAWGQLQDRPSTAVQPGTPGIFPVRRADRLVAPAPPSRQE